MTKREPVQASVAKAPHLASGWNAGRARARPGRFVNRSQTYPLNGQTV